MDVGNFRNFSDFPTHESIFPQSSANFKKIISDQINECRFKASQFGMVYRATITGGTRG
jgi:hypothetical protein